MNILADENVPNITINELRLLGHDVLDIRRSVNKSAPDPNLWRIAQREQRLIITTDKWFRRYREERHSGILIVLLHSPEEGSIHRRMMYGLARFNEKRWRNLTVVIKNSVMNVWQLGQWMHYDLPEL